MLTYLTKGKREFPEVSKGAFAGAIPTRSSNRLPFDPCTERRRSGNIRPGSQHQAPGAHADIQPLAIDPGRDQRQDQGSLNINPAPFVLGRNQIINVYSQGDLRVICGTMSLASLTIE